MGPLEQYYQNAYNQNYLGGQLAQQQAITNQGIWGGLNYGTAAGTAVGANTFSLYHQPVVIEEPKKKRFIEELREELNKWHGPLWSLFPV